MKTYDIRKVKLIDRLFLEIEFNELIKEGDETHSSEIIVKSKRVVHEDLVNAFDGLIPHLAFLSEQVEDDTRFIGKEVSELAKSEDFQKFLVTGISIGGSNEHEGVTISGRRRLKGNRVLNINSPFTKFDSEAAGEDAYERLHELYTDVNKCLDEACQFLEGKYKPSDQLSIEFDGKEKAA